MKLHTLWISKLPISVQYPPPAKIQLLLHSYLRIISAEIILFNELHAIRSWIFHLFICYSDSKNLTSITTTWCFGTVCLEKIEIYRDRISKGQVQDKNIPEYPFYVLQYIDEITKKTLLELFNFPEKALSMRWQYSELLKRYSKVLSNVTSSLQSVLTMIKSHGG